MNLRTPFTAAIVRAIFAEENWKCGDPGCTMCEMDVEAQWLEVSAAVAPAEVDQANLQIPTVGIIEGPQPECVPDAYEEGQVDIEDRCYYCGSEYHYSSCCRQRGNEFYRGAL